MNCTMNRNCNCSGNTMSGCGRSCNMSGGNRPNSMSGFGCSNNATQGCGYTNNTTQSCGPGMCYVPWQKWEDIYSPEEGFARGTIFAQLDKSYIGRKCK